MSKVFWIIFILLSATVLGKSRHSKKYRMWTIPSIMGCIIGVLMLVYEIGSELPPV